MARRITDAFRGGSEGRDGREAQRLGGVAGVPRQGGPGGRDFAATAQSTCDLVRQLLGVDWVCLFRVFGDSAIRLVSSPPDAFTIGHEIGGRREAHDRHVDSEEYLASRPTAAFVPQAVQQIAASIDCVGSAGVGLHDGQGRLIGLLVALREEPFEGDPATFGRVLTQHAELLGRLLASEIDNVEVERAADAAAVDDLRDSFTKMPDRRAWGILLAHEERRARSLGHPAAVLVVDAGPTSSARLLRRIGKALQERAGTAPALCRLDDRLWGVIITGQAPGQLVGLADDLTAALERAGATPSLGYAERDAEHDLTAAWALADERMFQARRARIGDP